jgi:hypothetical protein
MSPYFKAIWRKSKVRNELTQERDSSQRSPYINEWIARARR